MARQKKKQRQHQNIGDQFNFYKFDKLLEKLRKNGVNVIDDEYQVKDLKSYKTFKSFFDRYSIQEINRYLLFYRKQFDDIWDT